MGPGGASKSGGRKKNLGEGKEQNRKGAKKVNRAFPKRRRDICGGRRRNSGVREFVRIARGQSRKLVEGRMQKRAAWWKSNFPKDPGGGGVGENLANDENIEALEKRKKVYRKKKGRRMGKKRKKRMEDERGQGIEQKKVCKSKGEEGTPH